VSFFKPEELEQLIIGSKLLDFDNLQKKCKFRGGFNAEHPFVQNFFEVLNEFDEVQQRMFLSFSTGSDRSPVGGLGKLVFYLERQGGDAELLPEAHTCFNHLIIPEYATKEKLKEKMLLAI
jgi:ubiquitin-protein ligase E3 A